MEGSRIITSSFDLAVEAIEKIGRCLLFCNQQVAEVNLPLSLSKGIPIAGSSIFDGFW